VSNNVSSAHGGVSLAVSSWTLRGVIPALGRTPALRGYPGGIDASGPGWSGLTIRENHPEPTSASAPQKTPVAGAGPGTRRGSKALAAQSRKRRPRPGRGRVRGSAPASVPAGAGRRSVWQQSLSAWQDAGLEWQRPAGWETADADGQRTEPIPVVPAEVALAEAGLAAVPAAGPNAPSAPGPPGPPPPGPVTADGGEQEPGPDGPAAGAHGPAHPGRGRRAVAVGAVVCVALFAVAAAGIVITGSLNTSGGQPGPVTAYPPARLADGQFAGPGGSAGPPAPPSLTGIAEAGGTVVAIGSQATLPDAHPLVLMSPDDGHTWQRAVLRSAGHRSLAGAVPLMVAGGSGRWLAVAPDAVWTSPDGRTWQLGPGIAPLASGDQVRALARTPGGFVAAGENVHLQGGAAQTTPVLWTSANGLAWQRRGASQLDLPAGKGRAVALRWVAARGSVLMIAGEVARTVVRHRGKRKVSVLTESTQVWRSQDNGAHWLRADPPVSQGAIASLSGLAATASGIVAIRPGHGSGGARDAVAYLWARGRTWRFTATLAARRGASLRVAAVAGSDHGVVVAGSAGRYRVAFVSANGRSWRQAASLGSAPAAAVTGVTAGPGREVIAGGAGLTGPFLLLAGTHRRPVGQAALAGAAAAGLSVNGLGSGPGGQVAVGHAAGAPAIWSRPAGGRWVPVTITAPPSWHGTGPGLTSVVHGDAGWLAVGGEGGQARTVAQLAAAGTLEAAIAPAGQQPVLATSPDGRVWGPATGAGSLAGPGLTLTGAAAGPGGYVVAGVRDSDGQPAAALWWSPDLTTWIPQAWAGPVPGGTASAPLAVAAGQTGFAAVGAAGTHPAVWVYRAGQGWQSRLLAVPAGAASAVLQRVSIQGRRIAALGVQARPSGPVPFAAVSVNGGRTWREEPLPVPGGPASVTALITAGGGFVGAGTLRASRAQDVIVWWSPDGLTWHAARPAGRWLSVPGAQQITGLSVSGGTLTGVGSAATGTGQRPVLWRARIR